MIKTLISNVLTFLECNVVFVTSLLVAEIFLLSSICIQSLISTDFKLSKEFASCISSFLSQHRFSKCPTKNPTCLNKYWIIYSNKFSYDIANKCKTSGTNDSSFYIRFFLNNFHRKRQNFSSSCKTTSISFPFSHERTIKSRREQSLDCKEGVQAVSDLYGQIFGADFSWWAGA